jgi:hypothetical protein
MRKLSKAVTTHLGHIFNYPREANADIRLDMEQRLPLPRPVLDWFTGKIPLGGKSRRGRLDPLSYLAVDLAILGGATASAALLAGFAPPVLAAIALPPLWLVQTGRLRKMQTLEGHEAAHSETVPGRRSAPCWRRPGGRLVEGRAPSGGGGDDRPLWQGSHSGQQRGRDGRGCVWSVD